MKKIPFTKPTVIGGELENIQSLINGNLQLSGIGTFNKSCEKILSARFGSPALLVTSCSHALELSALVLDIKPGDEVICPSFTFVTSVSAFLLRGAVPRFADNDAFGNLDIASVESLITPKTKAVVVVHYAGNSCDMDKLSALCKSKKIHLVEDAAQSIGSLYKGKNLGTFGQFGCLSFHDTKNITSGEGGALIVNNPDFHARAEIVREKGTNRSQFLQGLVDKYTWVDMGSSYVLSELNAAYLLPQIESLDKINRRRGEIWNRYKKELDGTFANLGANTLGTPEYNTPNYHTFAAVFPSMDARSKFITHMREHGITTPFHYVALHTSPVGKRFIDSSSKLPMCMRLSDGLVRLPLYYNMPDEDVSYVIDKVKQFSK